MNRWIRQDKPLVIAHRGSSLIAPENTLVAYRKAVEAGADMLEVDINISKDGELVMIHDHILGRTVNTKGRVIDYTLAELREMDAGSNFHPDYIGVRIPTCEETFQFAKDARIQVCFEIKGGDIDQSVVIAEELMKLFNKYDAFKWASISSYHPEATARCRKIAPHLMITRERLPDNAPFDLQDAVAQARLLNSQVLLSDFSMVNEEDIQGLHAAGIAIWTWNPYKKADILTAICMGSDGIMGDDPALARNLIDTRGRQVQSSFGTI